MNLLEFKPISIDELDFPHEPRCEISFGWFGRIPREYCFQPATWFMTFTCCGNSGYCCNDCKKRYEREKPACKDCKAPPLPRVLGMQT